MIQKTDLGENKNLFVVSVILIAGVGGFGLNFSNTVITEVACALVLGILVNVLVNCKKDKKEEYKSSNVNFEEETKETEPTQEAE